MTQSPPSAQATNLMCILYFVWCSAVTKVLEEKGILSELRAKIRAEIYESLQIGKQLGVTDGNDQKNATINEENANRTLNSTSKSNKKWTKDEILIHELIKEYMLFHGLQHSLSVFGSETNCGGKVKLQSESSADQNPLLYDIVKKSRQ